MPVLFNSSGLIPAPFVSITKSIVRNQQDLIWGQNYTITLNGTIVNTDGTGLNNLDSPGASGVSETRMRGVQAGQNYIRTLFSVDNGLLEIYSPESQTNKFSAYCKPESITFDQGNWVQKNTYQIVLSSKYISNDLLNQLESVDESWDTQESEDGSSILSHKVQAKGRLINISGTYNSPLALAKQWVNSRLYNTSAYALSEQVAGSGIMYTNLGYLEQTNVLADGNFSNRVRSETTNPLDYSFGVTETFLWTQSAYKEEYNVTVNMEQDWPHKANISVNGVITGLSTNIYNNSSRMTQASGIYATFVVPHLYPRAVAYAPAGYTVNPAYISRQIQYDVVPGNLRYGISYSALCGTPLVSGAVDETIEITDAGCSDIFAQIPVPGRTAGPVFQNMSTKSAPKRSVSISAIIGGSGNVTISNLNTSYLAKPNTDDILNALKPGGGSYYYVDSDQEVYNPFKRTYSRQTSWTINLGSGIGYTVPGIPSGAPHNLG